MWVRLSFRRVDALLMRTAKNPLHIKGAHLMLAQASEDILLNVLLIACIGIIAEVSMNDRFTVTLEENAEHGFARSLIVGA